MAGPDLTPLIDARNAKSARKRQTQRDFITAIGQAGSAYQRRKETADKKIRDDKEEERAEDRHTLTMDKEARDSELVEIGGVTLPLRDHRKMNEVLAVENAREKLKISAGRQRWYGFLRNQGSPSGGLLMAVNNLSAGAGGLVARWLTQGEATGVRQIEESTAD